MRARHFLTLGERSLGPFVASREGATIAGYVAPEGGAHHVFTIPLTEDGAPSGDARDVGAASGDATNLVLRAAGGPQRGFLAAWTALADRGEALLVAGLGDDGAPRAKPTELARTASHLAWVELVSTQKGAVCVWVEETRSGDANVLVAALDGDGKLRGVPARVARGVTGWHAVAAGQGVGIALVTPDPNAKGAKGGSLGWLRLDAEGAPIGVPQPLVTKASIAGDVEVVRSGDGWLFAWTDRSGPEPVVMVTSVDESGKVQPPRPATETRAGSVLLALASGPAGTALAWEEPQRRPRTARQVRVTRLASKSGGEHTATLELVGRGAPELVAHGNGFSLLAPARACKREEPLDVCGDAPVVPTLIRLDASMNAVQSEPVWLGDPAQASAIAWGLKCDGAACTMLAATGESPTRVHSVSSQPRESGYRAPLVEAPPDDAPRLTSVTTLASGAEYADIATTKVDGGALVALVTSAVEAKGQGAQVIVRPIDTTGKPSGPPVTLSTRALTAGGVAIAAGGTPDDGAAVAWVARDSGTPEVHVTRVDRRGRRQNDVQLTTAKSSASDVAIGWADGGWIVAWVDRRDGNGEVYATKVGIDLNRIAREERITNAPGDASEIALLARPNAVWLAWADARESPNEGFADVYLTSIRPRDAKRASDEVRVLASAAHSRSPSIAPAGEGLAVAWIEEPAHDAARSSAHGVMLAHVDAKGTLLGPPARLRVAGAGHASGVVLDASSGSLRAVVARAAPDDLVLDAVDLTDGAPGRAYPLHVLDGPPTLDVAMSVLDGALFFNDEGTNDRRALRAALSWRR
jgi:hypothetical protein